MINILRKKFFLGYTIGDTTLSIIAFSIMTLSITIKNALLSIMTLLIRTCHAYAQYLYSECNN
jgi:hypothetical protein